MVWIAVVLPIVFKRSIKMLNSYIYIYIFSMTIVPAACASIGGTILGDALRWHDVFNDLFKLCLCTSTGICFLIFKIPPKLK